ncbi:MULTISPECIES: ThuA domain-containing protein [unclassified Paenibacillus]|uniref:ThuA domain-containing protein n=1 Tax=unclassified Paenibacillus TaxID=185978 RepID=UPI00095461FF|nr:MULTISPECIES: ThuA domain-containing protein [unclassified Paenibacillus]ASS66692.1 trehalose utilization protein ThuA [Paenibacillus sp. RUD330]SIP98486.1 Trehalose utilization protein [Paenibacillus sp. RU4X]SIQ17305.1 Trehalose utilization protein [Paenibacillus sp. RU4T]
MIKLTIWNEFVHEKEHEEVRNVYPDGIHNALAKGLADSGLDIKTATLEEAEHGLSEDVLNNTDVLIWWGHMAHDRVEDAIVERVHKRVMEGMGLIVLHSGHFSKIFKKLMGTGCDLKWREAGERERIWVVDPAHPITAGLPEQFALEQEEMYGEHFDIPAPDELVFVSWFEGGNVFRSGCTFHRGQGKIFYFRPGHETHPTYYDANVLKVISNSVKWAAPSGAAVPVRGQSVPSLEPISPKNV